METERERERKSESVRERERDERDGGSVIVSRFGELCVAVPGGSRIARSARTARDKHSLGTVQ